MRFEIKKTYSNHAFVGAYPVLDRRSQAAHELKC